MRLIASSTTERNFQRHLQFEDNRLLPHLYGKQNEHLLRIETRLGIRIGSRGGQLALSGAKDNVRMAVAALDFLYRRLKRGLDVNAGEVDAALRFAMDLNMSADLNANLKMDTVPPDTVPSDIDACSIATRKRRITPRSPGQMGYIQALEDLNLTGVVFGGCDRVATGWDAIFGLLIVLHHSLLSPHPDPSATPSSQPRAGGEGFKF